MAGSIDKKLRNLKQECKKDEEALENLNMNRITHFKDFLGYYANSVEQIGQTFLSLSKSLRNEVSGLCQALKVKPPAKPDSQVFDRFKVSELLRGYSF